MNVRTNYQISIARPHNSTGLYMIIPHVPGAQVKYAKTIEEARAIRDAMWNTPREDYKSFKKRSRVLTIEE